jgi:hypothetical protein
MSGADSCSWWYSPILPADVLFPASCRQTLTAFVLSAANHLSRKRPADAFLDFLTRSSSILIIFFNELATAVNANPNASTQEAVQIYLDSRPDSNLANLVNVEHQQQKLDLVAEDMLQSYLEHKAYNCEPVRIFLREVLSKLILDMTIQTCSTGEFINDWIVYLLEDQESDSTPGQSLPEKEIEPTGVEKTESPEEKRHRRVVSKAQEAMDEAMREAARLTQMIAEDDAKRQREHSDPGEPADIPKLENAKNGWGAASNDDISESTKGMRTPSSSQSDHHEESPPQKSPLESKPAPFTTFDQIVPSGPPTALKDEEKPKEQPPLTLYKASIIVMDDSDPTDRASIRNKPQTEYLIQVEPTNSHYPGWMIVRRYGDFEALHQVLSRIARVTDAARFADAHATLPAWKGATKPQLRDALERYLADAVAHVSLADSEGMKRFLEKDVAVSARQEKAAAFGLGAIESVGKGVVGVLSQAPRGVASGGKAIIGGVSGVLAGGGARAQRQSVSLAQGQQPAPPEGRPSFNRSSTSLASSRAGDGFASAATTPAAGTQQQVAPAPRRSSSSEDGPGIASPADVAPPASRRQSGTLDRAVAAASHASSLNGSVAELAPATAAVSGDDEAGLSLPPPPSCIPDDYEVGADAPEMPPRDHPGKPRAASPAAPAPARPAARPLGVRETQTAVSLGLAAITELYKLSSAWSVRLAFLTAAKTILLRPGNAQLDSVRVLLQESVLDAHASDAGVATLLRKTRLNALPTEEERAAWPAARGKGEKEELRARARKVLVERGMPVALNGVMGQAASAEALGRVFDAVQMPGVARGLVFGLVLQGLRAVTQ